MLRSVLGTLLLAAAALASSSGAALSPRYDHSAIGVPASPADTLEQLEGGAKRYASLIALHGVLGFLAWQVVAPLAVVIAAVGKSWGPLWFRAHWRMQLFFVAPVTVIAVVLAAVANAGREPTDNLDLRHKITGYVILGAIAFQALAGFYSHHRQVTVERFAAENGRPVAEPKRRLSNWVHMALGIGLLTITGLEITWGIYEFKDKTGVAVPTWLVVLHWVVAGLPVLIVTPFIIIRGILRLRRGASFSEAFFTPFHSSSSSLTTRSTSGGPRKLFLNSSTYLSTPVFDVDLESEKASSVGGGSGVGYAYARGGGADGRQRVDSLASSSWPGASTREEYEAEVASSRAPESVVGSSAASFASWTTVARDYPSAQGVEDDDGAESVTLLSAAGAMGATNERKHGAGPPQPASSPTPATYPPTPIATRNVVSTTPSLPPLQAIFSPVSSPAPLPPTAAATASPLSPRLSFMPFPGGAPVHPPAPPSSVGSSPAPTLAPSLVRVSSSEVAEGEGAGAHTPRLVPTPDAALQRARHGSLAAQVVDATPTPAQGDGLLPLPGEPDGNKTDSSGSDEEEDGTGVRDDSESTRLMDELERELTISTMRSGRSARSATAAPATEQQQEGQKAKEESQEVDTEKDDEQTQLEREQSGKWFGSNRLSSSS